MPRQSSSFDSTSREQPSASMSSLGAEELHDMVQRYRAILAAVPDIIMEVDTRKKYTWANQAGKEFFGEDVVGHSASDYFIEQQNTYEKVEPLFLGSEDTVYLESWQRRRDGESRLLAWWCRTLKDDAGTVIGSLSTARDITERRQATEALRDSEQRLRSVLRSMPVLLDAFDENRNIIEWNDECARVTGFSAEEVIGHPHAWEQMYPDADYRHAMLKEWSDRGNNFRNWEWDIVTKEGQTRTISWSNISDEFPVPGWSSWAVGVDVTERRKAEKSLRENEAFLNTIFKNGPYAAWISDEKGTMLRINQACCDILNITEEQVVGKYNVFQDNLVREQGCMNLVRQVFEEGKTVRFELDYNMTHLKSLNLPNSARRILDIIISPIQNEKGKVVNAIIQHVDITDRKNAVEKVNELNAGLEQRVLERTEELRRAVHLMAGREIRMAELKDVIRVLRGQLLQNGIEPMVDDPLVDSVMKTNRSGDMLEIGRNDT